MRVCTANRPAVLTGSRFSYAYGSVAGILALGAVREKVRYHHLIPIESFEVPPQLRIVARYWREIRSLERAPPPIAAAVARAGELIEIEIGANEARGGGGKRVGGPPGVESAGA